MEVMDRITYDAGSVGVLPDGNFRVYIIYLIPHSLSAAIRCDDGWTEALIS